MINSDINRDDGLNARRPLNREKQQNTLLDQLQSIKILLASEVSDDGIPLLKEKVVRDSIVDNLIPQLKKSALQKNATQSRPKHGEASHFLIGQHPPLNKTDKSAVASPESSAKAIKAIKPSNNPFLPEHLRQRLASNTLSSASALPERPPAKISVQEKWMSENVNIIDEVIAEFMPKIEARLRAKLTAGLGQNPTDKNTDA
ncbi:MAG: hypothetical protein ACJA04_001165 [Cellvibrionaceae bacterium]